MPQNSVRAMGKINKPIGPLINEVKCLVDSGQNVLLPVNGRSMLPFIIGGRDSVELHAIGNSGIHIGDVVLAITVEKRYVIHRVVKIEGDNITLEGDGNINLREHCSTSDIIAQAVSVADRKGHRHSLVSRRAIMKWKVWHFLSPIRLWLLRFYKLCRIFGIHG